MNEKPPDYSCKSEMRLFLGKKSPFQAHLIATDKQSQWSSDGLSVTLNQPALPKMPKDTKFKRWAFICMMAVGERKRQLDFIYICSHQLGVAYCVRIDWFCIILTNESSNWTRRLIAYQQPPSLFIRTKQTLKCNLILNIQHSELLVFYSILHVYICVAITVS